MAQLQERTLSRQWSFPLHSGTLMANRFASFCTKVELNVCFGQRSGEANDVANWLPSAAGVTNSIIHRHSFCSRKESTWGSNPSALLTESSTTFWKTLRLMECKCLYSSSWKSQEQPGSFYTLTRNCQATEFQNREVCCGQTAIYRECRSSFYTPLVSRETCGHRQIIVSHFLQTTLAQKSKTGAGFWDFPSESSGKCPPHLSDSTWICKVDIG